jgi:hypothetical protein
LPPAVLFRWPLTGTWRWPAVTWTLRIGPLAEVTVMAADVLTCLLPLAGVMAGLATRAGLGRAESWSALAGRPELTVHAASSSPAAAAGTASQRTRRWADPPITHTMSLA